MKKFIKLVVEAAELHGKAQPEYAYFMKNIKGQNKDGYNEFILSI
ncbi:MULTISPECIES: hypothetical protein [Bacillaceae]|uniref:Uncharacterized protein n=1 Tax=Peribacillus huizhouensis TaxID=1501239 RepID=A0ABR6CNY9_9BACI|nr:MULTISPECIES: hypothetical protein [Bacillaceae]MBA9026690.1 hypothetical protein [Peribacillus huizhouensis]